jgi:hypothetical protein
VGSAATVALKYPYCIPTAAASVGVIRVRVRVRVG